MDDDLTPQDWEAAQRVLRAVLRDPGLAEHQTQFKTLVAGVNRLGRKFSRQQERLEPSAAPTEPATSHLARCYICKRRRAEAHATHPALCPSCGAFNAAKRLGRADLSGRVAVLTGGRIKIGYETSLKLLRDGARVIVTSRFPQDAARRYALEPDAATWHGRLDLYRLDLRDLRAVQAFVDHLHATEPHLDLLINNAAQTIARPRAFYAHLLAGEAPARPPAGGMRVFGPVPTDRPAPQPTDAVLASYFPAGALDADGQQLDLRPSNSWSALLADIGPRELLEVQLANAVAPFMLCSGLRPLLLASPFERRFIVNVSAMEGQFAQRRKSQRHPHTNMAKAALNMLTRTSGPELARDGIYMTSVDTGWVSNQQPHPRAARMTEQGFVPPLDMTDAASRVYDPVVVGLTRPQTPYFGVLLKDYRPYPW